MITLMARLGKSDGGLEEQSPLCQFVRASREAVVKLRLLRLFPGFGFRVSVGAGRRRERAENAGSYP